MLPINFATATLSRVIQKILHHVLTLIRGITACNVGLCNNCDEEKSVASMREIVLEPEKSPGCKQTNAYY